MGILVALAGMLVPLLGGILYQANCSTAAITNADVMNNLQLFQTTNGYYPQNMDSLITSGTSTIDPCVWNGPSTAGYYTAGTIPNVMSFWRSFGYASSTDSTFSSNYTVMDFPASPTTAVPEPYQGGTVARIVGASMMSTGDVAVVNPTVTLMGTTSPNPVVVAAGYPNGLPTGVSLIAMGVGPQCAAVGQTMAQAPMCSAQTQNYYGRYIAIFATYANGQPATLQAVVDAESNSTATEINNYKSATKNTPAPVTTSP